MSKTELDIEKMMINVEDIAKSIKLYDVYCTVDTEGLQLIWDQYDTYMIANMLETPAHMQFELWLEGFLVGYPKGKLIAAEDILRKL